MSDEIVTKSLIVNGESRTVAFPVHHTLLEVLREELGLTGTKHGCELGECGTCTVLVDGQPVLSCLALAAEMAGKAIETVEGLQQGNELHPLQSAFADLGAAQCGYCTPGILMTAKALLAENPRPGTRGDPRGTRRQPLPLHRLHQDPGSGRRSGGAAARRELDTRRATRSTERRAGEPATSQQR